MFFITLSLFFIWNLIPARFAIVPSQSNHPYKTGKSCLLGNFSEN